LGLARELPDPPKVLLYFHVPPRRAGAGPGWYMGPSEEQLTYIGYSAAAAEVELLQRLKEPVK
jgi:hypothetical protein